MKRAIVLHASRLGFSWVPPPPHSPVHSHPRTVATALARVVNARVRPRIGRPPGRVHSGRAASSGQKTSERWCGARPRRVHSGVAACRSDDTDERGRARWS
jgi:hypothetical protein